MGRSLLAFLALLLGTVGVLLALAPSVLDAMARPAAQAGLLETLGIVSFAWVLLEAIVGGAFVVGFADLHGGGEEAGRDHGRSLDQAAVFLVLVALLWLPALLLPSPPWPLLAVPWFDPPSAAWIRVAGIALPGFRALFGGLALYYSVASITHEDVRIRLLLAMTLGVIGAFTWPSVLLYATQIGGTAESLLTAYLAGIVAGGSLSGVSLAIYAQCFRRIRDDLRKGVSPETPG